MVARSRTERAAPRRLARALGWFSLGLGAAELMSPRSVLRAVGMEGRETLLRGYGLREIATGMGVLASADPRRWIWGRVLGDAVDVATIMAGSERGRHGRSHAGLAVAALVGVAAADILCASALEKRASRAARRGRRDYSDRAGVPRHMRGAARAFVVPRDIRGPEALRSYPAS